MYNVDVYVENKSMPCAKIEPLKVKRDWIAPAVYNCTPLSLANSFGYGIYFDEDLSFIWDGDYEVPARCIKGEDFVKPERGGGTVSFNTNLIFKTDPDVSMLTIPVPNQEFEGATVMSTILSTSFFSGVFPIVWKLKSPNKEYFVPAGTYVGAVIPISVASFQGTIINYHDQEPPFDKVHGSKEYIKALKDSQKTGKFLKLYSKEIDHLGNKLGSHEARNINLKVSYGENND